MTFTISSISPLMALLLGILVLVFPKFLNYYIAFYLIVTGLLGLGILK